MSLKSDFSKIFRESFKVPAAWSEWFLNDVYRDEDLVSLKVDDRPVSVLLMSPYTMAFHGIELPASYFSCVATARAERGKGYMSRLMIDAIRAAEARGDAFATLIPETRRLYFFYDRFGFSTVFY
ncbi:MAG: GNAT family N-acetyltransferase, partial [Muribaculaceae bacterium]|nr:GNAT family N-acetyltransferase [Muribaculaceae bacterium]